MGKFRARCCRRGWRKWAAGLFAIGFCPVAAISPAMARDLGAEDLSHLSLQELSDIQITSVSKSPEPLREAPAAIYVITHDEIERSGAASLAEALRLAPNLRITQLGSSNYVASVRGFGGHPDVQAFSNKLLLLIDGRSVYSPLFSGIYLDAQDLMLGDIDRIEVISGPGATLWGANAMNGVINVITRPAYLTDGTLVVATAGNRERDMSARYGGKIGDDLAYRFYGKVFQRDAMTQVDGTSAQDDWYKGQAGFRIELSQAAGTVTLQGDVYEGDEERVGPGKQSLSGENLLGRWQFHTDRTDFQLQGYFDHTQRGAPVDGVPFVVNTFDLEAQQSLSAGSSQRLVWGAGARAYHYDVNNSASLLFLPPTRTLQLWNLFVQDTLTLSTAVKVTLGLKLEHHSYTGWEPQPDARLAWQVNDATLLWAAVSRAIRSPTPLDDDVAEKVGGEVFLQGNPDFQSEKVVAYEVGYRGNITPTFSLSVSSFYNVYDDLRTVEPASSSVFLPLRWDNLMKGHTYGVTAWAKWQVADWWRIAPGFALLRKELTFKPGASALLDVGQSGNDPRSHALLTSSMELGTGQTLDVSIRHVAPLAQPALPSYTEMSARFGWRLSAAWELSLAGTNLLHARHQEYPSPAGVEIGRSVMAGVRWRH